jgi:hypothetical protein
VSKVRRLDVAQARAGLVKLAREHPELAAGPQVEGARAWLDSVGRNEDEDDRMTDETKDAQLVVRLPQALMERLDAYAEALRAQMPGAKWVRADVARMLLTKGLDAVAPVTAPPKGKRSK